MNPRVIILTGHPQEGKSTLLEQCLNRLNHLKQAGFLARGLWKNNRREGFDLVDLGEKTVTPLARRNPLAAPDEIPFTFFQKGMQAGAHALDPTICAPADLICVDEVGKLELRGEGWAPFLPPLLKLTTPVHLWVVRQTLLEQVCRRWNLHAPSLISINQPHPCTALCTRIRS